jgi:hypothetical protein
MKRIFLILAILAIAGCAATAKTEVKRGKKGMHINCSGLSSSWDKCYSKAASSCSSKGYKVIARSGDSDEEPGDYYLRHQPGRLHQPQHDRDLQVDKKGSLGLPFSLLSDRRGARFSHSSASPWSNGDSRSRTVS